MAWFTLTDNKKEINEKTLYQIRYLENVVLPNKSGPYDFSKRIGDLGGWIESEENLSQELPVVMSEKTFIFGKNTQILTVGVLIDSTITDSKIMSETAGMLYSIGSDIKNIIILVDNSTATIANSEIKGAKNNPPKISVKAKSMFVDNMLLVSNSYLIADNMEEDEKYAEKIIFVNSSVVEINDSTIKFPKETIRIPIYSTEESRIKISNSKIFDSYLGAKKSEIEISNSGVFKKTSISSIDKGKLCISNTVVKRTKENSGQSIFRTRINGKMFVENSTIDGAAVVSAYDSTTSIYNSLIVGSPMIVSSEKTQIEKSKIYENPRIKDSYILKSEICGNCKISFMQLKNSTIKNDAILGVNAENRETRELRGICFSNLNIADKNDFVIVNSDATISNECFVAYRNGTANNDIYIMRLLSSNKYLRSKNPYYEITRIKNNIIAFMDLTKNELAIISNIKKSIDSSLNITEKKNKRMMELLLIIFWIDCLVKITQDDEPTILEKIVPVFISQNPVDIKAKTTIAQKPVCIFPKYANELLPVSVDRNIFMHTA